MIVWEWTVPPQYMHVQPDGDSTPVPAEYLNTEKYQTFPFLIRSSDTPCQLYIDKDFYQNFVQEVENLPRIEEEWIKEFGVGQPTVIVVVYVDMPEKILDEAKLLADKYFTYRFLASDDGFDYL